MQTPTRPNALVCLSLVVPAFNEEETVRSFIERVNQVFAQSALVEIEFVFVNDGSTDETLRILLSAQTADPRIKIIDLSRNFGKEAALTAGIHAAQGDVVVPIDADLQDPPELIPLMLEKWREGYDVVLAKRIDRTSDSLAKRASATWFYRVHNLIANPQLPENVGDFRLIDRCVVEAIKALPESRRFMKGLFAWVGFDSTTIEYNRPGRTQGSSKFNGWKLWNFALEGITSFSTDPLRIWTYLGFTVSLAAFAFGVLIVLRVLLYGVDVPGYASIMVTVTFLGGLQLMGIGVIGEYLGRTYLESKRRPTYIVRRIYQGERGNGP